MPTSLITGVSGQDGRYLAEYLLAQGWDVHGVVRSSDEAKVVVDGVRLYEADLRDPAWATEPLEMSRPDAVFNLAGISSVVASWEQPVATAQVNGVAVVALLEAARELQDRHGRQIRIVQASSAEIFGAAREVPQRETTPLAPVSPYGASKAYAHSMVQAYRARGLFASNAILYNHESPQRPATFVTRRITRGVAAIARGDAEKLTLGNLDAQRDWGWAPDFVRALVLMAEAEEADDFVVGTGRSHTVREFVDAAFRAAGIPDWVGRVEVDPRFLRPVDAPEMRADASRIRARLGWAPTYEFEEIVSAMVRHDLVEDR